MDVWKIYAYISNGEVKGLGLFLYTGIGEALRMAKLVCEDESAFEVDVTYIPVQVGDTYSNGSFYRNGVLVEPFPSKEEQIEANTSNISSMDEDIDELWVAILEG